MWSCGDPLDVSGWHGIRSMHQTPSWPGSWVTPWPAVQEGWCGGSPGPRPYWVASGRLFFWGCHRLWALAPCYVAMLQGSQGVLFLSLLGLHRASGLASPYPASGWVLWRAGVWQMECRMGPVVSPYLALSWWAVAGEGIYWKSMLRIPRPTRLSSLVRFLWWLEMAACLGGVVGVYVPGSRMAHVRRHAPLQLQPRQLLEKRGVWFSIAPGRCGWDIARLPRGICRPSPWRSVSHHWHSVPSASGRPLLQSPPLPLWLISSDASPGAGPLL